MKIPVSQPSIGTLETEYVLQAIQSAGAGGYLKQVTAFEQEFATYHGKSFAHATSCATGALHLGLSALGVKEGDEVILCDLNWVATVAPVLYLGATPVLVDACKQSWCIDPEAIESAITPRTRAIVVTHLYGNLCAIDRLVKLSHQHGIPLVEDAAEALGSRHQGKLAGTFGAFSVFSFHGSKTITTLEGGMLITDDSNLYEQICTLNNHGRSKTGMRRFSPERLGYKYKMTDLQAALGRAQLSRVEEIVNRKREIFNSYRTRLSGFNISMNPEVEGDINSYWMPSIVFPEGNEHKREVMLSTLERSHVDARVFFPPLSSLPFIGGKTNRVTAWLSNCGINLPSFCNMTDNQLEYVCNIVEKELAT